MKIMFCIVPHLVRSCHSAILMPTALQAYISTLLDKKSDIDQCFADSLDAQIKIDADGVDVTKYL